MNKTYETTTPSCSRMRGLAIGLLCGAAAGAALGLLFAPKSGIRLRRDIGAQADRLRRKAADLCDDAAEAAADVVARGKQLGDKVRA